ncbi:2-Keto-3-deoxy-D-manno-octulosonate-8-phosphate synthase [Klebsiella michiganensis]|nr:2-Keto-3-deoxy-D-manno-octulosonate-8-phosphate synthase [Klebsiella michiganensis]
MKQKVVSIGDINVANDLPFVLFGGMNVLESPIWRCVSANTT